MTDSSAHPSPLPIRLLAAIGGATLSLCRGTGAFTRFTLAALAAALTPPWSGRLWLRQMLEIGWLSLPVVGLTAVFSGMVLALQTNVGFARFDAESAIATVVVLSITRELGPVLAGLMVAGRVGAAIAAEIGTMRVTEQIDALTTLGADPVRQLVAPRLGAAVLTLPLLVLVADIIGVAGGWLIATERLGFASAAYLESTWRYLERIDVLSGLVKAAVFGLIIALAGCWHGWHSERGAQGVGAATTRAVVSASIAILAANYTLTQAFFA